MNFKVVIAFFLISILLFGCTNNPETIDSNSISETNKLEINTILKNASKYASNLDSMEITINLNKEALRKSEEINYFNGIIKSNNNLGYCYTAHSKLIDATEHFYKGMKNAELILDSSGISSSLFGLGLVMYDMNNWEDGIKYFSKSLDYTKTNTKTYTNISRVQYLLALCYAELNRETRAKSLLKKAYTVAEQTKDTSRIAEIRLNLNFLKSKHSKDSSIINEYQSLYKYFINNNEKIGAAYTLMGISKHYKAVGDYEKATYFGNQSLQKAKKVNVLFPMSNILNTVIDAEYLNKNYKAAYQHSIERQNLKDSMQGIYSASQVTLMQVDYEFDKNRIALNKELEEHKRQRILWMLFAVIMSVIILVIFYLLRRVSKERKKSDKLLLNILPERTAKELKKFGKAQAESHNGVTIVFADIKEFTKIASGLSADIIVEMLDIYFSEFDQIIEDYKLEKIKTIGDAYMFVGGLHDNSNSEIRTINASLAMLDAIETLNIKMLEKYKICFAFRFGLHTGEVVSGVVGKKKYAFDIWGDTVNLAARMEENSTSGKLNVTEETYIRLQDFYDFEYRGKIEAKNRGKIKMYYLNGIKKNG